jgi:DNA (cytosine-5)-methyltransferase 1
MKRRGAQLRLVLPGDEVPRRKAEKAWVPLTTIDLFCGAGGITEGFREADYRCLYANDCMPEAIETFLFNHPEAWAEPGDIEALLRLGGDTAS